jgi:hypothetical protein
MTILDDNLYFFAYIAENCQIYVIHSFDKFVYIFDLTFPFIHPLTVSYFFFILSYSS